MKVPTKPCTLEYYQLSDIMSPHNYAEFGNLEVDFTYGDSEYTLVYVERIIENLENYDDDEDYDFSEDIERLRKLPAESLVAV